MPDLVRPLLELEIMGDAALEGDGLVFRTAWRLAAAARVTPFTMLHHLGGPLERAHLADAGDVLAVPFDAEFEVLVRVETLRVDRELCHGTSPTPGCCRPSAG